MHDELIERLRKKTHESRATLEKKFPHATEKLRSLGLDLSDLRRHSANVLSAAALAGGVLLASPVIQSTVHPTHQVLTKDELRETMKENLEKILPDHKGPLSPEVEKQASEIIAKTLGINATASLDGNHLNTSYGYIGAEQHLPRYPGDTIAQHDALQSKGITPGKGAWGYFAASKQKMTEQDVMREKYYVAVQTLYLPNWKSDLNYLRDWYKYREVLVVNPKNGKSVVAVIADAGPAAFTGKQFGGSPEVMEHLEMKDGKQKGKVLIFFIDPKKSPALALGPVETKHEAFIARK